MNTTQTHSAIVAGAGPVGMVAALLLADRGAEVTVFEKTGREVQPEWRGSTLHPPTLEILDEIGLATAAVDGGVTVEHLVYGDLELPDLITFDYRLLSDHTRFPKRIQYEQYKMLRLLRDRASEHPNIAMRWNHEVQGCTETARGVSVDVAGESAGHERVESEILIAADGSHSAIRRSLDIAMPGDTYPTLSLVAATDFDLAAFGRSTHPVAYYSGPHGRASFIKTPDVWRIAVTTEIPAGDDPALIASMDEELDVHPNLRAALDFYVSDSDWESIGFRQYQMYRSHQRVAERFSAGRIALVGDAAHLASTTGGMGLNSGVHDAYDLVERLGRSTSPQAAIAEYDSVRRAVSLDVVQRSTTTARAEVDQRNPEQRRARVERLSALASDDRSARDYLIGASMLDAVPIRAVGKVA